MSDRLNRIDPRKCDPGEFERWLRVTAESELRVSLMTDEAVRREHVALLRAVWGALDDSEEVPTGLYPVDVVEKYLQRGNIEKDGDW